MEDLLATLDILDLLVETDPEVFEALLEDLSDG